jgi:fluoride ion exporter CrcB/FEX
MQDGLWVQGLANMFGSATAGLVAAWLGFVVARVL